jgi:WD40 repeat protein
MAHPVIHSLDIQSVVYSPSGETIISVDNKDVCFWDSDTGALLSIFKTSPLSSFCTSVAFSLDSKFFVTEYQDGSMLLRELATGASIATFNLNINYYPRGLLRIYSFLWIKNYFHLNTGLVLVSIRFDIVDYTMYIFLLFYHNIWAQECVREAMK